MFRKLVGALVVAVPLVFGAGAANALPIGLALVIDGSGSIDSDDFDTQVTSYINALNNLLPADGSVAVGVWQFGNSTVNSEFAFQVIDDTDGNSDNDLEDLTDAIDDMSQLGGNTPLGAAITAASDAIVAFGLTDLDRAIIDVSTDGFETAGGDPDQAADDAITAGIDQVNCIGVQSFGSGAPDCSFIAGIGAFAVMAGDFEEFEEKLEEKLARELNGVPEPTTLLLLGMGLVGLGLKRARG